MVRCTNRIKKTLMDSQILMDYHLEYRRISVFLEEFDLQNEGRDSLLPLWFRKNLRGDVGDNQGYINNLL
jgi:hypothetical protein